MLVKRLMRAIENPPIHETAQPGIDETIDYIEWLMAWYCRKPSNFIANIIVSRLEDLRKRGDAGEAGVGEWSCDRLVRNWQYIAERHRSRN